MRARAVTVLLCALVLAGCGSDDPPQPAPGGAGAQLTVTETDFALDPAEATVATAGSVSIEAINDGQTVHALSLEVDGQTPSTGNIEPGETASVTADLEPGRYTWYCPVADHRERGMSGTLTVGRDPAGMDTEPSAPASPGGSYGY